MVFLRQVRRANRPGSPARFASSHGYDGLTQSEIDGESGRARDLLRAPYKPDYLEHLTDDLCSHLAQAVSDGFLTDRSTGLAQR